MPSALQASRDYLAQALARVRAGASEIDRPGPEIKVDPFEPGNVTTAAALIKLGTSIQAARRKRANAAQAERDKALEREKAGAQIALIRAQEKYALGEGRQPEGPRRLEKPVGPYAAGTPIDEARLDMAQKNAEARARGQNKLRQAQEGLRQVDKNIERDVQLRAQQAMFTAEPVFEAVLKAGENANPADLIRLGIEPMSWKLPSDEAGSLTPMQRNQIIQAKRAEVYEKYKAKHRKYITRYYQPDRDKYQSVIDSGLEEGDPVGLGGATAEENPLGLEEE